MSNIEDALKKMENNQPQDSQPEHKPTYMIGEGGSKIDERIIAYHQPATVLTERFKQINTVMQRMPDGPLTTLAFTSALKGEGKSVIALNSAVALAQDTEGTVCIVDADLRNPQVHTLLGLKNDRGLTEYVQGKVSVDDVAMKTSIENLHVITAGRTPSNPPELFASKRAGQVIRELRSRFDYVIFDTAPVLATSDTMNLAPQLEGLVMVVQAGRTARKQADRACKLLAHANVIGLILNKAEQDATVADYV